MKHQKIPVIAIKALDFSVKKYPSLLAASTDLQIGIKEISTICNKLHYRCSKGWTFKKQDPNVPDSVVIQEFSNYRKSLDVDNNLPQTRICFKCKIEKPLTIEFFHRGISNGKYAKQRFKTECKECRKGTHKKNYADWLTRTKASPILTAKALCKTYLYIDKKEGREFDLTPEWIVENVLFSECVYCGTKNSLGVERINNKIGHIISNCAPCCKLCNITRMDNFTHTEFKLIGALIKKIVNERDKTSNN